DSTPIPSSSLHQPPARPISTSYFHLHPLLFSFFFFNDTATTEIYTLSLHDALPISRGEVTVVVAGAGKPAREERPPDPEARARALLAQGMTRKDVAERLAEETGIARNTAYRLVNEL